MKTLLLCLFCTLVHIPSIVLRYEPFKEEIGKKQKKTLLLLYGISLFLNACLYALVDLNGDISIKFYKYDLVLFCIVMACFNGIVIRNRGREHIFTFGLTATVIYLFMAFTAFVEDKLPISDVEWQVILNAGTLCVLFVLLYPWLGKLMRQTITPFLRIESRDYWKNLWFVPVAMFFASLLSFPMHEHVTTVLQMFSRLMIGAATLFICRNISYDYAQLQKREELNQALDRQKEYYQALAEKVEEARRARHDFKHHAAALEAYVDKADYDGLADYVHGMSNSSITRAFIPFTGNSAADGIIYHYVLLCEKEKINFETEGMLRNVQIADVDLGVLLGNVLDNAYTACCQVKGERFIQLAFQQRDGLLTITVQNSYDGVILTDGETILSRKREHAEGVGLSSMEHICEKYGGDMKIGYEGTVFSVMMLLN